MRDRRTWHDQFALPGAALLLVAISIAFAWTLRYAPDESSHRAVVDHYVHHLGWMTRDEWQYGALRGHGYNLFSPVPYLPYLPFALIADHVSVLGIATHRLFVTRLGGTLVAIAQLLATIALVRRMCRGCGRVEVIAVALAANLVPQLRYIHAYVNADAVTILTATIAFALLLRILQRDHVTLGDAALVGLTVGVAAHGRYNGFLVAGLLLVVYVVRVLRSSPSLRAKLRLVGVAIALPVLLAGAFHLHVYNELQNRHMLATADNEQLAESTFQGHLRVATPTLSLLKKRVHQAPSVWMSSWASMAKAPGPNYADLRGLWLWLLFLGSAAGVVGLVVNTGTLMSTSGRFVGLAAVAVVLATWVLGAIQRLSGLPGRFLLTAGIPALAAAILGSADLLGCLSRVKRPVLVAAGSWSLILLAINIWAIAHVAA
ncbi:MAG: hypothetical protein QOI08_1846 [Actinomycetota bacterium]|jgi:hypothetical protein|nr:hypothetical protein [Actinomycetota bacterium]